MMNHADKVMDYLEKYPLTTLMIACRAVTKTGHRISAQSFQQARRQSPILCDRYSAYKVDKVNHNLSVTEKAMMKRIGGFKIICVERTMERQIVTIESTGEEKEQWVVTKEKQIEKYFPPSEKLIEFYLETKGNYIRVLHVDSDLTKTNEKSALSFADFQKHLQSQGIDNVTPIYELEDDGKSKDSPGDKTEA